MSGTPEDQQQTEAWAQELLDARLRAMGPADRLALMNAHSVALQELSMQGLRMRYPDDDDAEIWLRAAALRIGVEEFAERVGHRFDW
ncbi:MAG: hypothetical protein AAFZ87_06330 [Planctomycetota bacterium]